MDKITQLFIRASKSEDSITRLQSVYRRFYGNYGYINNMVAIGDILTGIVDDYSPMTIAHYRRELSSYKSYDSVSGEETEYYLLHLYIMRDKIRHISREKLDELGVSITPARFRNRGSE